MNVLITTRNTATTVERGRLTEAEVQAVLNGDASHVESLVIAFVDYYFHENVFTLSYLPAYRKNAALEHSGEWIKRLSV